MKASSLILSLGYLALACGSLNAQQGRPDGPPRGGGPGGGGGGPRPEQLGETPADLGSSGIVWYPILKDGLAEARRTNKPIMFMAVASQCGGVSGVF
ncbi:hypothetical protein V2O64_15395 [Verrucomicrobiaceae bacterium 227]